LSLPPKRPAPHPDLRARLALLRELTEAIAVSGDEAAIRQVVSHHVGPYADEMRVDVLGNLLVTRRGRGRRRPRVMVAAHMDEVGVMVTSVEDDGSLRMDTVGAIRPRDLVAKPVLVGRGRIPGVIGAYPPHLTNTEDSSEAIGIDDLRIDIGADSQLEALARVKPGNLASFATSFKRSEGTIRAKALDDRIGVATLIELIAEQPEGFDLLAAFTVQEEVGARGAEAAAYALAPDAAVALDCTPANDLPVWDGSENTGYNARLGGGPAVYVADKATISDPRLLELFQDAAVRAGIIFQLRQPGGGATDAGAIHLSRRGVPSISVSVPGRYVHTAAGIASLDDWRASVRLLRAALPRIGEALRVRRRP
jgi:putative aminopeptidase FrvX